jgi:dTDP-4-dehydrorhamnose 3,5-epimerase
MKYSNNNFIKVIPQKIIKNKKGDIIRALRLSSLKKNNFKFKEAYFTKIKYKNIKGWKLHKKMTLNLFVAFGAVKFVFFSEKKNFFKEIISTDKNCLRVNVPPKTWVAFKGIKKPSSIILNITDLVHSKREVISVPLEQIKYNWK